MRNRSFSINRVSVKQNNFRPRCLFMSNLSYNMIDLVSKEKGADRLELTLIEHKGPIHRKFLILSGTTLKNLSSHEPSG